MGNDAHLRIKGRIAPAVARQLRDFHRDWSFEAELDAPPADPIMREVHSDLEHVFEDMDVRALKDSVLDLDASFKAKPDDARAILAFLGVALESLEEGWMHDVTSDRHLNFVFDRAGRKVSEAPGAWNEDCSVCALSEPQDDEDGGSDDAAEDTVLATDGSLWRKRFFYLMGVMASVEKQRQLFKLGGKGAPSGLEARPEDEFIECWLDLSDLYLEVLGLEKGLAAAEKAGHLTGDEVRKLAGFHALLTGYFPEDYEDDDSITRDPKWLKVVEAARQLRGVIGP